VGGPTRGHLDYLTNSCGEDGADASLGSAIKAVGLASFAHASHAPSLYKNARYQYTKALQATNNALRSPVHVKKDSTLTAIMVLSIFETITGCNQRSLQAWAEHVNGAAALLKLRGRDQLNTPRGRRMFIQVASSLQICCVSNLESPFTSKVSQFTRHSNPLLVCQIPGAHTVDKRILTSKSCRSNAVYHCRHTSSNGHSRPKSSLNIQTQHF